MFIIIIIIIIYQLQSKWPQSVSFCLKYLLLVAILYVFNLVLHLVEVNLENDLRVFVLKMSIIKIIIRSSVFITIIIVISSSIVIGIFCVVISIIRASVLSSAILSASSLASVSSSSTAAAASWILMLIWMSILDLFYMVER